MVRDDDKQDVFMRGLETDVADRIRALAEEHGRTYSAEIRAALSHWARTAGTPCDGDGVSVDCARARRTGGGGGR